MDLTPNAPEVLAFITPQAMVFKWNVMPFGVANAPALFLLPLFHLMNKIRSILQRRPVVQELMEVGRYLGALGRGEAPHGFRWRCRCDEQEEAPRLKRGGGLHPARPGGWPPNKAAPGRNCRANLRRRDVLVALKGCAPVLVHVPSFGRNLRGSSDPLLGFQGAWLSHAPPRVQQQRSP